MTANRSPACASKLLYRPALLPDALVAQHAYFGTSRDRFRGRQDRSDRGTGISPRGRVGQTPHSWVRRSGEATRSTHLARGASRASRAILSSLRLRENYRACHGWATSPARNGEEAVAKLSHRSNPESANRVTTISSGLSIPSPSRPSVISHRSMWNPVASEDGVSKHGQIKVEDQTPAAPARCPRDACYGP